MLSKLTGGNSGISAERAERINLSVYVEKSPSVFLDGWLRYDFFPQLVEPL